MQQQSNISIHQLPFTTYGVFCISFIICFQSVLILQFSILILVQRVKVKSYKRSIVSGKWKWWDISKLWSWLAVLKVKLTLWRQEWTTVSCPLQTPVAGFYVCQRWSRFCLVHWQTLELKRPLGKRKKKTRIIYNTEIQLLSLHPLFV